MDFIREFPESEGFNAILVITDQFTKVQYYILFETTYAAEDHANCYINDIWSLHGYPKHTTRDNGLQYAWKFLKEINR